ncbi:MAG: CPBP family intramembrane metalloprotease [Chthonomonadales bacterium]|nr:CPBP family intramembrane metalloprotease [Chthonomonadales bacterium]
MTDDLPSPVEAAPAITGSEETHNEARRRNLRASVATLIVSGAVVSFLTVYNMQPCPVWSMDRGCFTARSWEEYLVVNLVGLLLLPFLTMFALPREGPHQYGLWRPRPDEWRLTLSLYALMLVPLLVAARQSDFMAYYPLQQQAAYSWPYLLYYETSYGLYMLGWEFFYRGFMTFGLARFFGAWPALLLQAIAFGIMHIGKPTPEVIGSFFAAMVLGWLALRARSFYPAFVLHWACSVTFDVLVIAARPDGLF